MLLRLLILASFVASAFSQSSSSSSSVAVASTISTQDLAGLPICAQNCLANSQAAQGSCSSVDIKCLCTNVAYINALACCLDTKCNTADQQQAVSFNVNICSRVNVTIPNFLGCAVTGAGGVLGTTSIQGQTSAAATITRIGSVVSISSNAPIAKFTGRPLLTGTCSSAMYASATLGSGTILQYPWEGCSLDNPGCCPFDVKQPGPLSVCPKDYFTTSGACCPTGWSVYPSALYGSQTPCYSFPSIPLSGPLTARALGSASTSTITTQLFSLRYPLKTSSRLSTSAIVGISVGVGLGVIFIAALLTLFIVRRRRARRNLPDQSAFAPSYVGPMDPKNRRSGAFGPGAGTSVSSYHSPSEHISELPSPTPGERQETELWFPPGGGRGGPAQRTPEVAPVEMPGDTHMDQHHPAYNSGDEGEGIPRPASATIPEMVSPVDAPRPLGLGK